MAIGLNNLARVVERSGRGTSARVVERNELNICNVGEVG